MCLFVALRHDGKFLPAQFSDVGARDRCHSNSLLVLNFFLLMFISRHYRKHSYTPYVISLTALSLVYWLLHMSEQNCVCVCVSLHFLQAEASVGALYLGRSYFILCRKADVSRPFRGQNPLFIINIVYTLCLYSPLHQNYLV